MTAAARKIGRRQRRSRRPSCFKLPKGELTIAWNKERTWEPKPPRGPTFIISNLDYDVTNSDIYNLFVDFGPLKESNLNYDVFGRSLGTATVIFFYWEHGIRALRKLNGQPLDGRPLQIELAISNLPTTEKGSIVLKKIFSLF